MAGEIHNWDSDNYRDCNPSRHGGIGLQRTTTQSATFHYLHLN